MWLAILIMIVSTPDGPEYLAQPRFIENISTEAECNALTSIFGEIQVNDPTTPFTGFLNQCFEISDLPILTVDEEINDLIKQMLPTP